jgi:hypothetical protein
MAAVAGSGWRDVARRVRSQLTRPPTPLQQLMSPFRAGCCPRRAAADPAAAAQRFPLYFDPSLPPPLVAEVRAGECLYLPAMWLHWVAQVPDAQQRWTVAVNYW